MAATAGAAAWVAPEILTAKPAAGATLSGDQGGAPATSPSTTTGSAGTTTAPGSAAPATSPATLAFTGIDITRDAEIGAALIAGGWAMHHWASRTPNPAPASTTEAHEAGSQVDPI